MEIIASLLLILALLKLVAITNAVHWARRHGNTYGKAFAMHQPESDAARFALLEAHNGRFFPFGAKDYQLRRFCASKSQDSVLLKFLRPALARLSYFLFNARRLVLIASLYLLIINTLVSRVPHWYAVLFCILGVSLMAINIGLVIEAISWYIVVRNYARPYFMLGFGRSWPSSENRALNEITVFRRLVTYTILSSAVACSVASFRLAAFNNIVTTTGVAGEAERLLQSVYFVMSTLFTVGYGDITPASNVGRFIAILIMIQSFMLLSFLLSVLLSITSQE